MVKKHSYATNNSDTKQPEPQVGLQHETTDKGKAASEQGNKQAARQEHSYLTRLKKAWASTHLPNRSMMVLTALILVTYIIGNYYSCSQLGLTKQALQTSQRAYLSFVGLGQPIPNTSAGGKVTQRLVPMMWENSGTTPMVEGTAYFGHMKSLGGIPAGFDYPGDHPEGVNFTVSPKGNKSLDVVINTDELNEIQNKTNRYFLYGTLVYRDVFQDSPIRVTEFCTEITFVMFTNGFQNPDFGDPKMGIGLKTGDCKEHNCYDNYCPDYKKFAK